MVQINRIAILALVCSVVAAPASAAFIAFSDEALWRAAAGTTVLEDFESYSDGSQIPELNSLNLVFDELAGGGFPQAYLFSDNTPHGSTQLGNFPNGINETNRWNDTIARPAPGFVLRSMGFWNGDGQSDTLVAFAYNASGDLLGSVGAFTGTFAGFVSDTPIASVRFEGDTGDGWNHLDGLQVNAVPETSSALLFAVGLGVLAWSRQRSRTWFKRVAKRTST